MGDALLYIELSRVAQLAEMLIPGSPNEEYSWRKIEVSVHDAPESHIRRGIVKNMSENSIEGLSKPRSSSLFLSPQFTVPKVEIIIF